MGLCAALSSSGAAEDSLPADRSLPPAAFPVSSPPPQAATLEISEEEYAVQPEDVLQITVYEEPDLTTKARVTNHGEITVPLLGRLSVAGMSVTRIQEELTTRWSDGYLVNPQVQVFIDTYHPRNVFVTGSVNKPGSYQLPTERPTTLMEAITMAGGFSERAAIDKTRIIRVDRGREQTIQVKANEIIKKGDKSQDVPVKANDIIFVPESVF